MARRPRVNTPVAGSGAALGPAAESRAARLTRSASPAPAADGSVLTIACVRDVRSVFFSAGPPMAGRTLPAMGNLLDADGAVSPARAAAPAEAPTRMRRTRIESHPCTQPLKEAPPSLSLRSSPPAPTRSRRTPLELLPYTWPLRRGTPKLPPRSSSPPPEPAARNDSWSTPPKHPSCPARKDVTGRCFSSHPGTTNVLSNSRWTNPKKYCPISLLKVVCLGHDVPALRRACGWGDVRCTTQGEGSPPDRAVRAHRRDRGRRRCGSTRRRSRSRAGHDPDPALVR